MNCYNGNASFDCIAFLERNFPRKCDYYDLRSLVLEGAIFLKRGNQEAPRMELTAGEK